MRACSIRVLLAILAMLAVSMDAVAQKGPSKDEQTELQKGEYAYVRAVKTSATDPAAAAKDFATADEAFRRMLDPEKGRLKDPLFVNDARMYWGATLVALGRKDDAAAQFERILEVDKGYQPDPVVFPVEVANVFFDAQKAHETKLLELEAAAKALAEKKQKEAEAARVAQIERLRRLEQLVSEEYVEEPHSRWIALLPFGVGQFQNGRRGLGYFFLATEALLAAGDYVTIGIYLYDLHQVSILSSKGGTAGEQARVWNDRAVAARYGNLGINVALLAAVIAGAIEAEFSFVPDLTTIKPRELPKGLPGVSPGKPASLFLPSVAPMFSPWERSIAGAQVTFGGSF